MPFFSDQVNPRVLPADLVIVRPDIRLVVAASQANSEQATSARMTPRRLNSMGSFLLVPDMRGIISLLCACT